MTKIALCVSSLRGGGAERVVVNLANKLHEWGHDVDIILGHEKGPYNNILHPEIRKIVLSKENAWRGKFNLDTFMGLLKYFKTNPPAVLMSTVRELNVIVGIAWWISRARTQLFVREADTFDSIFENPGLKSKLTLYLMRWIYPKTIGVFTNSDATRRDILAHIKVPPQKVFTIYNPLDLHNIKKLTENSMRNGKTNLVACGRLDKKKNFSDLIRSLPFVLEKYPEAQLKILGEGKERKNIEALITRLCLWDSVTLEGFVDNPFKYFASANVFVQTALWEGFGYVLAEAMACGTPVVAYDGNGAMREILADGKYGKLVAVGDLKALADNIASLIEYPTSAELLREGAQRFDLDKIAKEYLKFFRIGFQQ